MLSLLWSSLCIKVPELKQVLKERGLSITGTKAELLKRLEEALGAAVEGSDGGLDDSIHSIDNILNDDSITLATKPEDKPDPQPAVTPQKVEVTASNGVKNLADTTKQNTPDTTQTAKPAEMAKLSEEERLKLRAKKFGAESLEAKKELRAQRFGLPASANKSPTAALASPTGEDIDVLKKRADRFGAVVSSSLTKADEEERKRKRAERFGTPTAASATPSTTSSLKVSTVTSTDSDIEAKKKKRAERFGLAT
ncbi:SAP domain-containing ribonucleoprotein-like isoform X2 [Physella acuta]|uniref:SAP domain-containing ribonucleoprotein-like isoform X2 n=1 Tax=Physella acuta TaxID=109671 RepID=UPI0027DCE174|nr:SAP domain-containing ribonucleoprotein-like isoform X2 [Physella acuta]